MPTLPTVLASTLARPACSSSSGGASGPRPAPRGAWLRHALRPALHASTAAASQDVEGETDEQQVDLAVEAPRGDKATSLGNLSMLGRTLLMNAASLRAVRGQTHCTFCRGTGRETCTACQGTGVVKHEEKVRMNSVRHAASKLKVLLSLEVPKMNDDDWMRSNRCKRCHGTGALKCKHCGGSGRLGPS